MEFNEADFDKENEENDKQPDRVAENVAYIGEVVAEMFEVFGHGVSVKVPMETDEGEVVVLRVSADWT